MSDTLEQQVLAQEARRFAAFIAVDDAQLRACMAPDLVYVHSTGLVETREQVIQMLVSGARKYVSYAPTNRQVRILGNTAVVHGDLDVGYDVGGKQGITRLVYSTVYALEGTPRMVHWHACSAPAKPA